MHRAFTLIELLVTLTVILILTAILVPGISRMRRQAEMTRSINTLKALTAARMLQTVDEDGRASIFKWRTTILPYLNIDQKSTHMNEWKNRAALPYFQCRIWLDAYGLKPTDPVSSFAINSYPWTMSVTDAQAAEGGVSAIQLPVATRILPRTIMMFHAYSDPSIGDSARDGAFYSGMVPVLDGAQTTTATMGPPYGRLLVSRYDGSVEIYEKSGPLASRDQAVKDEWIPYERPQ